MLQETRVPVTQTVSGRRNTSPVTRDRGRSLAWDQSRNRALTQRGKQTRGRNWLSWGRMRTNRNSRQHSWFGTS
jgi:hypothetical protein